jgi:hypothetical protein
VEDAGRLGTTERNEEDWEEAITVFEEQEEEEEKESVTANKPRTATRCGRGFTLFTWSYSSTSSPGMKPEASAGDSASQQESQARTARGRKLMLRGLQIWAEILQRAAKQLQDMERASPELKKTVFAS